MNIPESFKLFGHTINVVFDNTDCHISGAVGLSESNQNTITLADKKKDGEPIPESSIEQTFYHELLHMIYDKLGYYKESKDEIKIEQASQLLYQAISTFNKNN